MTRPLTGAEHPLVWRWMPLACSLTRRNIRRGRLYADWDDLEQIAAYVLCDTLPGLVDAGYDITSRLMTRVICHRLTNLSLATRWARVRVKANGNGARVKQERIPEVLIDSNAVDEYGFAASDYAAADARISAWWLRRHYCAASQYDVFYSRDERRIHFAVLLAAMAVGHRNQFDATTAMELWGAPSLSATCSKLTRIRCGLTNIAREVKP